MPCSIIAIWYFHYQRVRFFAIFTILFISLNNKHLASAESQITRSFKFQSKIELEKLKINVTNWHDPQLTFISNSEASDDALNAINLDLQT